MKKRSLLTALLIGGVASLLTAVGCASGEAKTKELKLVGFDDAEITVEMGEQYLPDLTSVQDEEGNVYTPKITVWTTSGNSVWSDDGEFKVSLLEGYKVVYTVKADGGVAKRTVTVKSKDTTAPTIKFLDVRTEVLADKYESPNVYVTDNSGEDLEAEVKCYKLGAEGEQTEIVKNQGKYLLTDLGSYKYVASVTDGSGNTATLEKPFYVVEMGEYVWEDFSSANRLENIIVDGNETCFTEVEWLEEFEGAEGVAKISPNYYPANNWGQGDYVAIRLNKTYDQLKKDKWGSFTIRMYIADACKYAKQNGEYVAGAAATNVTLQNESLSLGSYKVGEWVDVTVSRKDFFQDKKALAFKTFNSSKTLQDRYERFAEMYTCGAPCYLFRAAAGSGHAIYYIDSITWTEAEEDVTAPAITYQGGTVEAALNSLVTLPTVVATDDWDAAPSIKSNLYYDNKNTEIPELVKVTNNTFTATRLGEYYLDVEAKDASGNVSTSRFTIHVVASIDEHIISSNNYPEQGGTFAAAIQQSYVSGYQSQSSSTWLEEFEGKQGVAKIVADNVNQYGFGYMKLYVPKNIAEAMKDAFGYVTITLYIEVADIVKDDLTEITLSPNPAGHGNHSNIPVGQWTTITINRSEFLRSGGVDAYLLTDLVAGSRPTLYSNQIKWDTAGENVIINNNKNKTLSGADAIAAGMLTYYIDEIRWDADETAPEVTLDNYKAYVGRQYDFAFDVTDTFDPTASVSDVTVYTGEYTSVSELEGKEGTGLTGVNGGYSYTVPTTARVGDKYTLYVVAKDASGNTTEKLFVVTVEEPLAPDVVSELNSAESVNYFYATTNTIADKHTSTSSVSYLESYDGATGVVKVVADNATTAYSGYVALKLSSAECEAITASDYDFITLRMQVSTNIPYEGLTLCFGPNKAGTDYYNYNIQPNTWFEMKIALDNIKTTITNGTATRYTFFVSNIKYQNANQIRYQQPYGNAIHTYNTASGTNTAAVTYGVTAEQMALYSTITYYIDSVKLGKAEADVTAPTGVSVYQNGAITFGESDATKTVAVGAYFTDNLTHATVTVDGVYRYDASKENGCGEEIAYTTNNSGIVLNATDFASGESYIVVKYKAVDKAGNTSYLYGAKRKVTNNRKASE